uniref:Uncharacterized protein n=1 Tax=Ditylenchus dipsaci TaxID=166011 RepID=A0A915D3U3_9BILA
MNAMICRNLVITFMVFVNWISTWLNRSVCTASKKSLSTVKFLSGTHFPQIEGYYVQINEMRCGLKRFHSFVCETEGKKLAKISRMLMMPVAKTTLVRDYGQRSDDGSHDVPLSQLHDLLSRIQNWRSDTQKTVVAHKQLMVRNAPKLPCCANVSQIPVCTSALPIPSIGWPPRKRVKIIQFNMSYREQIQCAEDNSGNIHRQQQCVVQSSEVMWEFSMSNQPLQSPVKFLGQHQYQAKVVHLVHNTSFPVNNLW